MRLSGVPSAPRASDPVTQTVWAGLVAVGMVVAAVVLALSGWDLVQIIGLLTAMAAVVTPILALMRKTDEVHTLINSQHDADLAYRQKLSGTLRAAGIEVPVDATGNTD